MNNTIRREILLQQPPDRVWLGIADSTSLAEWMFPNDFLPRVGHRFTFQVPPNPKVKFEGLTVHCEVLECEVPSRLVFSWSAGGLEGTHVSFQLEPNAEGTRLVFQHSGFDASQTWSIQAFKGAEYGWAKMLGKLPEVVAGLADERPIGDQPNQQMVRNTQSERNEKDES